MKTGSLPRCCSWEEIAAAEKEGLERRKEKLRRGGRGKSMMSDFSMTLGKVRNDCSEKTPILANSVGK